VTFIPLQAMAMTYSHANVQGQRSVGSEDRVETNGRMDGGDHITSHANAVGNNLNICIILNELILNKLIYFTI